MTKLKILVSNSKGIYTLTQAQVRVSPEDVLLDLPSSTLFQGSHRD